MNIFTLLSAIALISGVSALSATTLYTQSSYNTAFMESSMIEDAKKNEMIMAELLLDGSINVANHGQTNSTIVKLEIFDGATSIYSTIFGNDILGWQGITITEKDTTISPLGNMTILDTGMIDATSYLTGYITTSYGNKIKITNNIVLDEVLALVNNNNGTSTGNGTSITDGLGVNLDILNIDNNGKVFFGDGDNTGSQTDIRQYVEIGSSDDWVIVITDDAYETLFVPEFGKEYRYVSGTLVNVTNNAPNILGYSESRSLSGNINIVVNPNGISFSGTGEEILKLHDYDAQSLLLRGDGTADNIIKIITSDQDLMNDSYYSDGYLTYSASIDPGTNSFSVTAGIDSIHTGVLEYTIHHSQNNLSRYGTCYWSGSMSLLGYPIHGVPISNRGCAYEFPWSINTNLVKTNQIDHHTITGDSTTSLLLSDIAFCFCYFDESTSNYNFKLYDTLPSTQKAGFTEGQFEQVLDFTSDQTYIYVKLGGGSSSLKGEAFDPLADTFFQVNDLPVDIAYDVSKSGVTGAVGKTSNSGEISLLLDDVDFGVSSSPGGILKIYPNSTSYMDDFGIGMIDLYNGYSMSLSTSGDDLAFIPQSYIRLVLPVAAEVENVHIDDTYLDDLNKNYTKNDAIMTPVIPNASIWYATINGEDIEVLMQDVDADTTIKHVSEESSTTSARATSGSVSTTSNISTSASLYA